MKKKVRKTQVLAAVLLLAAILTAGGCGSQGTEQEKGQDGKKETEQGKTFDNYGREITVTAVPEKVLTLGPNCTELFCALGLEEYVIGNSLNNHSRGALPKYEKAYGSIPELNYSSITRESALSSGADFIYGIDWEFGEEALGFEELDSYGITAYMNAAGTLEEAYREILDLGEIFQIQERAEAFVEEQRTRIKAVEDKVAGQEPLKILVYDTGGEGVFTCGGTNFETMLIELAGGRNIFDDITDRQWTTVSYEEVLDRQPDIILIHDYDAPSVEDKITEIKNNTVLAQMDCVKEERFAVIALESVLPGGRMAYAAEELAKDFYPGLF